MKVFNAYIKQYRMNILLLIIAAAIFALVFSLYNLRAEAVLYALLLCVIPLSAAVAVHYIGFYKKHRTLLRVKDDPVILSDMLPDAKNLIERDYAEIIKRLNGIMTEKLTEISFRQGECMDYFTAWAHQIKSPIAAMRLILQSSGSDADSMLLSELFSIEKYTEMALSYFRLDSETNDFILKEYPLDGIIRSSIRAYAPIFIRKRLTVTYDGTDLTEITDEKWLSFILEQIISNAVKYTNKGGVTISVSRDKVISVSDTGIGIYSEDIPRIFEKGFTGYNGHSDKKSTGIGLYLCKKAAQKLSHRIYVESEIGVGSTFYIDLKTADIQFE